MSNVSSPTVGELNWKLHLLTMELRIAEDARPRRCDPPGYRQRGTAAGWWQW